MSDSPTGDMPTSEARTRNVAAELLLQFFLIGVAVFLGLQADQWREDREHRDKARATLLNFRTEIAKNRAAIVQVRAYHEALRDSVASGMRTESATLGQVIGRFRHGNGRFTGIRTVDFSRTAWDLALATEALAYVDPQLAFEIADVYNQQDAFRNIQQSFLQNLFTPAFFHEDNGRASLVTVGAYLGDVEHQEPHMLKLYDALRPKLDSALGIER